MSNKTNYILCYATVVWFFKHFWDKNYVRFGVIYKHKKQNNTINNYTAQQIVMVLSFSLMNYDI